MGSNRLHTGPEGEERRPTKFKSAGEKWAYDASGLIKKAESKSEESLPPVDPVDLIRRSTDDVTALTLAINEERGVVSLEEYRLEKQTEMNRHLSRFKADFDKDPAIQDKILWEEARDRLLANNGEKLKLAKAMREGGVLFGVDSDGKLLFADGGYESIRRGMNYRDTRNRVLYEYDNLGEFGKIELDKNKQPIKTGYEMFAFAGQYDKSEEIKMFEAHTGEPFVKSYNKKYVSSWLESGDNHPWPKLITFDPHNGKTYVNDDAPQTVDPDRGVRRMLRV